jgi:RimJ/RimL family protein N-acetyltransferase
MRLFVREEIPELRTERLLLRPWRDDDLAPFAVINADPRVAQHLSRPLSKRESDALAGRIRAGFERHGFGLWAAERTDDPARPFIGFIGLAVPELEAPFTPCVEIGWRLASERWGVGLATEGARTVVRHAFDEIGLDEIVSFTAAENLASRRVIEKLGMHRDPADDFDHPRLPVGHRLRRHVLYRLCSERRRLAVTAYGTSQCSREPR